MNDPWLTAKVGDILIWEGRDNGTTTFRKVKILASTGGRKFNCIDLERDDGILENDVNFLPTDNGWRFSEYTLVQRILTHYQ